MATNAEASSGTARRERPQRSRLSLIVVVLAALYGVKLGYDWYTAPSLADLPFVAQPYTMFGMKPSFTRRGEPLRSTNALGYRGVEIEQPKPDGRMRIVCLGGSTTYGFLVADDQTYPVALQKALRAARPDLDIEVINAGVESYTTAESLANLSVRVLELDPDFVLVHHAPNDVRPRRYPNFDAGFTHYRKPWNGTLDGYEVRQGEYGGINMFIQHLPPDPVGDPGQNLDRSGTDTYRRNLLSMVGVARIHDVVPVFVTFAVEPGRAVPEMTRGCRQHNEVMHALSVEQDVALVDVGAAFPKWNGWQDHYLDSIHLDAEGCAHKGQLVAEGLLPLLP